METLAKGDRMLAKGGSDVLSVDLTISELQTIAAL